MSVKLRTQVSASLCLLILLMLVPAHFLGDPCLLHSEHTAQALESTLSCRMTPCLCFLHAIYFPAEAGFSGVDRLSMPAEEPPSDQPVRLLAFDIFHPPRA